MAKRSICTMELGELRSSVRFKDCGAGLKYLMRANHSCKRHEDAAYTKGYVHFVSACLVNGRREARTLRKLWG